ncbi:MAG: metallophosphoesterase [Phycisphaeraceae bacterium]
MDADRSDTVVDLTTGSNWEYRAARASKHSAWHREPTAAVAELMPLRQPMHWPRQWTAFVLPNQDVVKDDEQVDKALASQLRRWQAGEALHLDGRTLTGTELIANADGVIDLASRFGRHSSFQAAYLLTEWALPEAARVTIHAGADWWMRWWVDGTCRFHTMSGGNAWRLTERGHEFTLDLEAGRHVLAVRVVGGSGGWAFASEATREPAAGDDRKTPVSLEARRRFDVQHADRFASLTLESPCDDPPLLNGQRVPTPLPGMLYHATPGIPTRLVHPGQNVLQSHWQLESTVCVQALTPLQVFRATGAAPRVHATARLLGVPAAAARFQTTPVIGLGPSGWGLACRTTASVGVTLHVNRQAYHSPPGTVHQFDLPFEEQGDATSYRVTLDDDSPRDAPLRTYCGVAPRPPRADVLRLAIAADAGPLPDVWARVATQIADADPDLLVFVGDAVSHGRHDWEWDRDFFSRAAPLFDRVPLYLVPGNHDEQSPLPEAMGLQPTPGPLWSQQIGDTLLIGIDGGADWSPQSSLLARLDAVLRETKARYIFAFNHYAPWSSGVHTRTDESGRLVEPPVAASRETILPVLARHRVTALFSGHDHSYERSEPPGGVTTIIAAGAGAYLYKASSDHQRNPYGITRSMQHHHCLLEVTSEMATLRAVGVDSALLDEVRWPPRTTETDGIDADAMPSTAY